MKSLRQFLGRPVKGHGCSAEIWDEELKDGSYAVFIQCPHLEEPRRYRLLGSYSGHPYARKSLWDDVEEDFKSHVKSSTPW